MTSQRWFRDLKVIKLLPRYKDIPLQTLRPNQIALAQYGLVDASIGGVLSVLSMPMEGSNDMEYRPGNVHDRHGFWFEEHQSKSRNNRELINMVELVEEEGESGMM